MAVTHFVLPGIDPFPLPSEPQLPQREAELCFPLTLFLTLTFFLFLQRTVCHVPPSPGFPLQAPRDGGPTSQQAWGGPGHSPHPPTPGQGWCFPMKWTEPSHLNPNPSKPDCPVCFCWVAFSEPQVPHLRNGSPTMSGKAWDRMCMSLLPRREVLVRPNILLICVPTPSPGSGRAVIRAWGKL